MLRVNRKDFLMQLDSVLPGLSTREIIEQSNCFIFKNGQVITYNDEIACIQDSCLWQDVDMAIQGMPLISILRKLTEEEIDVEVSEGKFIIKGRRKRAKINMELKIMLPIDSVESPKKWKSLPDNFSDAISIVQQCAGSDAGRFDFTCIHLHPDRVEACDASQAAIYKLDLPLKRPTLIRKDSLRYIVSLDMTKFSNSKNWIHFKNSSGLIMSCRRWIYTESNYPNLPELMKIKGTKTTLPKGLKEAIEKAKIFTVENTEDNEVIVQLTKGKLKLTGIGASGEYQEYKNIKYSGKDLKFAIPPDLLADLVNRYKTCRVSKDKLKVTTGRYSYITALSKAK